MANDAIGFLAALEEIEAAKGISKEAIVAYLQEAMARGYRKELGGDDADVRVEIIPEKGIISMCQVKKIVEEVEDDFLEISVEDAKKVDPKLEAGDEFVIPASVENLKKATALSIKSILKQKFAEAEKNILYETFKDKINTMITGKVEKVDERGASVNIGKTSVFLPRKEMIGDEKFANGDNIKLFVSDVASGTRGAHIVVTRASKDFLRCLFTEEIHEIYDGTITIKAIAREAGERSKVAVYSQDPNVDPAGACIGPNGSRIQKVVSQLGNNGAGKEKIDIIAYSDITGLYLMEALKPAKVVGIKVDEENKNAIAVVKDDSLSLAIGRHGTNAKLAVKLTEYSIDIKTETDALQEGLEYQSYEELQALEAEHKAELAIAQRVVKEDTSSAQQILPGLFEGYVAPQDRHYDDEDDNDLNEALLEASEKEEKVAPVKEEPAPVVTEVKEEPAPVKEEKKVEAPKEEEKKEVKTTTSLEDLEKLLAEEANRNKNKGQKKAKYSRKKEEEEQQEEKSSIPAQDSSTYMSIYTEEELREMEEEDKEDIVEDDDVDYDEYDDYYDDDDR